MAAGREPLLVSITQKIAQDESRHYAFYMNVFREIIRRDPNEALAAASSIMPAIDMPGHFHPEFQRLRGCHPPGRHLRPARLQTNHRTSHPALGNRRASLPERNRPDRSGKNHVDPRPPGKGRGIRRTPQQGKELPVRRPLWPHPRHGLILLVPLNPHA